MALSKVGRCLVVALILAPAWWASAQSSSQSALPPTEAHGAPVAQPQPEPKPPQSQRRGRKKRSLETSTALPPGAAFPLGLNEHGPAWFQETRRSRDGGATRRELTFRANVLGGYDDNLIAGLGSGANTVPTAMPSGSTGYVDAALGYFRGDELRRIVMEARGNLLAYPGYLARPAAGSVATVDAMTPLGRTLMFRAIGQVRYEPFFNVFSLGASGGTQPGIGETVPAAGLFEYRSLISGTSVSLDRFWTQRDSTSLSYSYGLQQFTSQNYGDNSSHDVLVEYRRRLARGVRAQAGYRYVDLDYTGSDGAALPIREHVIEGGPEIQMALSRRRRLALALEAGVGYIESTDAVNRERYYHSWVPIGSGSASLGLSPVWSVEGGYRRRFSRLPGITDEVYTTDTVFLTTHRLVTSRSDLWVGVTYGDWRTLLASGVDETLNVYGASAQVSVALTAAVAATAGYFYYHNSYSNPGALPTGFPAEYDRHAVRVGLTMWIPLAGTSFSRR